MGPSNSFPFSFSEAIEKDGTLSIPIRSPIPHEKRE